jgi:RHS repeat-associated protein
MIYTCGYDGLRHMFISAASDQTSRFTGKERDETGLDYFGARYLSSALGRLISTDHIGFRFSNAISVFNACL